MAKTNMVEREKRRTEIVKKYAVEAREAEGADPQPQDFARGRARLRRRSCRRCRAMRVRRGSAIAARSPGRSRGVYRKFGLARVKIREVANRGEIPGPGQGELVRNSRMSMTDPIADLLTRIRNGQTARKTEVQHGLLAS